MKNSRRLALGACAFFLLAASSVSAAAVEVSGVIRERLTDQRSGDHRLGEGIANVLVSNGVELARTDAQGRYRLSVQSGQTVFVIKPAGYAEPRDAQGRSQFWRHYFPHGSPTLRYGGIAKTQALANDWDFSLLRRTDADEPLEVLVFGDPQPKTAKQADYFDRDIISPILQQRGAERAADLGLTLGDVVHDDLTLLPAIKESTERLQVPWLTAPGNHDLDFDAARDEDSLLSFRNVFGPDTLAWEEPQGTFIMLDDVIYPAEAQRNYVGGLREDQFTFLAAYLAALDVSKRLVIGAHIPFFNPRPGRETFRPRDRDRLFELLRPFKHVLLLTAHGHVQQHYFHTEKDGWRGDQPLHEYNVGATCGGFWGGVKDAEGIPDALMHDGTPNGYASLTITHDGAYALRWHVARDPDHPGIELHAPKVLRRGAWPAVGLFANVLMGTDESVVEYRIDGNEWQLMQRVYGADPRVLAINLADDAADQPSSADRIPEAGASAHLWRVALPTNLEVGEHLVEVRTIDRWRGELRAATRYRLVEPAE